jgi:hypothetical protein
MHLFVFENSLLFGKYVRFSFFKMNFVHPILRHHKRQSHQTFRDDRSLDLRVRNWVQQFGLHFRLSTEVNKKLKISNALFLIQIYTTWLGLSPSAQNRWLHWKLKHQLLVTSKLILIFSIFNALNILYQWSNCMTWN